MMREVIPPQPAKASWLSSLVDGAIFALAPEWGARRMAFRKTFLSSYEGAANDQTRAGSWLGSKLSPVAEQEADLPSLRSRSREMYRNDSFGGAVDNLVNHVVATGFTPQCRIDKAIVGTDAAETFTAELEEIYKRWSPYVDISGRFSLWQQTRLMVRHLAFDGEAIAVWSDDPVAGGPIPLVVEVIDPERLETPPDMISNPRVRLGIERDERGRITTYHIRKTHPFDTVDVSEEFDHIPARRVMHVFERWFAGQLRGLPWLTRCLNRAKDAKDNDEAEIIRRQVNACFAMFIETEFNAQTAANAAASSTDASRRYQEIRPGAIQYLNPGEKPIFSNPTAAGGYGEFQEITLRRIAAGLNMPFELMVKNWSGVSFAGGRLILNEWRLDVKSRQKLINELFLTPIWNRMVWEAVLLGQCSIEPRLFFARQYVYEAHCWTPPAWSYAITPGEEVKANAEAVRQNQRTLASVIAEDGGDLEDVLIQRKRENELLREYDILPPEVVQAEAQAASVEAAAQQKEVANAV